MKNVEHKSSGLASARLRLTDQVLWRVHHQEREGLFLDFGWLSEAHGIDTFEDVLISERRSISPRDAERRTGGELQAELLERFDRVERIVRVCLHICKLELDEVIGLM
jgi:hypothetical protein